MALNVVLGAKLAYIFGILNILFLLLVFFSCRCLVGWKFVNKMLKKGWYRKYYDMHCYYWWLFFASVIAHSVIAFMVFGNPF